MMNRKRFFLMMSMVVMGVVMVMVLVTPAAHGEGAQVIIDRYGCFVPDMNGQIHQVDGRGTIVWTNNDGGVVNVSCSGKLPAGAALPDRAVKFQPGDLPFQPGDLPLACYVAKDPSFTSFVFADDWRLHLTPGGQAQLICEIH